VLHDSNAHSARTSRIGSRGKDARLVPPRGEGKRLEALNKFRAGIRIKGESLSTVVKRGRTEERY
jgi:hypothetical protein